jgi:cytochrome P450
LNYITFDIIGDLSFGEPFGCLESGVMHPWVEIMFSSLRDIVFLAALSHLPSPIYKIIMSWVHWFVLEDLEKDRKFSADRVQRRLKHGTARSDFMSPILRRNDEKRGGMTVPEIEASFNILVVAGSETNATLLSGVLYTLSKNVDIKAKLIAELTSTFPTRNHVNIEELANLPYLNAVLEEGLRIYPPSAFNQARVVPQEGAMICGKMVPPGTAVGVATWAASRAETNWTQPEKFLPERWMGDGLPGDDRKSMQPFILGPRGCLGKK